MDPGGQLDMQQLLAAAQQMQEQLMNAQQELADAEVEGTAGGGLVTAVVNGQGELVDLTIGADAIDPASPEESAQTIADLVLAAVRDATARPATCSRRRWGRSRPASVAPGRRPGPARPPGFPGMPDLPGLPDRVPARRRPAGGP